jgi:hypothetical protein
MTWVQSTYSEILPLKQSHWDLSHRQQRSFKTYHVTVSVNILNYQTQLLELCHVKLKLNFSTYTRVLCKMEATHTQNITFFRPQTKLWTSGGHTTTKYNLWKETQIIQDLEDVFVSFKNCQRTILPSSTVRVQITVTFATFRRRILKTMLRIGVNYVKCFWVSDPRPVFTHTTVTKVSVSVHIHSLAQSVYPDVLLVSSQFLNATIILLSMSTVHYAAKFWKSVVFKPSRYTYKNLTNSNKL